MARRSVIAACFCVAGSACGQDGLLFSRPIVLPVLPDAGPTQPAGMAPPASGSGAANAPTTPASPAPADPAPAEPPPAPAVPADAGVLAPVPDASPAAPLPRPVVQGAAAELARIGVEGGDPRLGACQ